jgi:hypothetical protein
MKSRLATSIRSSFLHMNLEGRILVPTLLAVIVTAAAGTQSAPAVRLCSCPSPHALCLTRRSAEARKPIQAGYESMLAPDLYVQTPDRKLTRQEFIDAIFSRPHTLTRFDATVLTVEPRGNDWPALVLEKLEGEIKDNSGKTSKIYVMGVARYGWGKLNDNQWTLLWSEQLGQQRWKEFRRLQTGSGVFKWCPSPVPIQLAIAVVGSNLILAEGYMLPGLT